MFEMIKLDFPLNLTLSDVGADVRLLEHVNFDSCQARAGDIK